MKHKVLIIVIIILITLISCNNLSFERQEESQNQKVSEQEKPTEDVNLNSKIKGADGYNFDVTKKVKLSEVDTIVVDNYIAQLHIWIEEDVSDITINVKGNIEENLVTVVYCINGELKVAQNLEDKVLGYSDENEIYIDIILPIGFNVNMDLAITSGEIVMDNCCISNIETKIYEGDINFNYCNVEKLKCSVSQGDVNISDSVINTKSRVEIMFGDVNINNCNNNTVNNIDTRFFIGAKNVN